MHYYLQFSNEIITFCYENYEQRFVDALTRGEYFTELSILSKENKKTLSGT